MADVANRKGNGEAEEDLRSVRAALRDALIEQGCAVASDTLSMRNDLYVVGADDLARALFHFDTDAGDAAMTMYRASGSWAAGMPPRFAVLPSSEAHSPSLEMLEQMRAIPLFFDVADGRVTFPDLDRLLAEHVAP